METADLEAAAERPTAQPISWTMCPGCQERRKARDSRDCNVCGRSNPLLPDTPRRTAWEAFANWMLRPLGWFTQSLTILIALMAFHVFLVDYVVDLFWALAVAGGIFIVACIWVSRFLFWAFNARRAKPEAGRRFILAPLLLAFGWTFGQNQAAVKTGFILSRWALDNAAMKPASTGNFAGPRLLAGVFPVRYIQRSGNNVRLIIAQEDFIDSQYAGFAKCPQGCGPEEFKLPPGDSHYPGPSDYQHLGGQWYWFKQTGQFG